MDRPGHIAVTFPNKNYRLTTPASLIIIAYCNQSLISSADWARNMEPCVLLLTNVMYRVSHIVGLVHIYTLHRARNIRQQCIYLFCAGHHGDQVVGQSQQPRSQTRARPRHPAGCRAECTAGGGSPQAAASRSTAAGAGQQAELQLHGRPVYCTGTPNHTKNDERNFL